MVSLVRLETLCLRSLSLDLVLAAMTIANVVRTSLGPLGLDKMMVDDIGVSVAWGSIDWRRISF